MNLELWASSTIADSTPGFVKRERSSYAIRHLRPSTGIRSSSIYANGSVVILYSILPSSHSFSFELMRANWQEARTFSANREQSSESLIGIRDLVNKHSYPKNAYLLLRTVPNTYPSQALCRLYSLSVNAFVLQSFLLLFYYY